jgi:hypothetical protein
MTSETRAARRRRRRRRRRPRPSSRSTHEQKRPSPPNKNKTKQNKTDQYYAEENFRSTPTGGRVYTGPLLLVGFSSILGCFTMSTATRRSRNLSFVWLQRRVAAQFMTAAYFLTCNVIYSFDGRRWVTRDMDSVAKRMFGRCMLDWERRKIRQAEARDAGG